MQNQDATTWPIFVISLSDAADRRANITRQLNDFGMPFTIVDAVDGRNGLPSQFEPMVDRDPSRSLVNRMLTDAEFACALSHLTIYRHIVDNALPGAIVLEDDAILTPLFREFIDARGHRAADLIQLDHAEGIRSLRHRAIHVDHNIRLVRAASNATLTTGYSVSLRGAEFILANALPLRAPADWPCDVSTLLTLLAVPRVVDHPDITAADSAIAEGRNLALQQSRTPKHIKENRRFFRTSYWRRWWFKRTTRRIS